MDRINLTGLAVRGTHGVLEHEQISEQDFVIDVSIELNTAPAAGSDNLSDTIDYAEVADTVAKQVAGDSVYLLETLADRIAQSCLEHERAEAVTVTVHKPHAPLGVQCNDVSVTIRRQRGGRPVLRRIDGGLVA